MRPWIARPLDAKLVNHYLRTGMWTDTSLAEVILERLRSDSDQVINVYGSGAVSRLKFPDAADAALRVATAFERAGAQRGSVIALSQGTSLEAVACLLAAVVLGAVVVPISTRSGRDEVAGILDEIRPDLCVTDPGHDSSDPDGLRAFAGYEGAEVIRVGSSADNALLSADITSWADLTGHDVYKGGLRPMNPSDPALVAYTSGSTGTPKGVVHSHRTVLAELRQMAQIQPTQLPMIGAPLSHAMGLLGGLLLPIFMGRSVKLIEQWHPKRVLSIMVDEGVFAGSGSPYFLETLLDHPSFCADHARLMENIGLGGAPPSPEVINKALAWGINICRLYGSTEHPSITGSSPTSPESIRCWTDGVPLQGVEVKVVGSSGSPLEVGEVGAVESRGPDACAGYIGVGTGGDTWDRDGWVRTQDLGVFDASGALRIIGREDEMIIRGGENLSPREIEPAVRALPYIADVAIIGVASPPMGERMCAVVVPHGDATVTLTRLRRDLRERGVPPQKLPEGLRVLTQIPRTEAGKIDRRRLGAEKPRLVQGAR